MSPPPALAKDYESDDDVKSPMDATHPHHTVGAVGAVGASAELAHIHDIEFDHDISSRIVRKFDFILLPCLAFLYLLNALDKTNLGNAKTDKFDKDIGLTGDQYYDLVTAFYAPFCFFGPILAIVIKRFSAARVLPIMAFSFGTLSMVSAAVTNFGGIIAIRMLLAIAESAMLPGVVFYLSTFYTRGELARRVGIFYAAASIAGAFGGLIAYGIFKHNYKLKGWQILFLVEGAITVFWAFILAIVLPKSPQTARWLNERERATASARLLKDASTKVESKTDIRGAFLGLLDWHTIPWLVIEFCLGVPLASVSNFLPQVVQRLGYDTVKTNLLTVAPNIVGAASLIIISQSSDRFRERSIHLIVALSLTMIGFIVLGTVDPIAHKHASYAGCFLLTMGSFVPSVLVTSWVANNTLDESRRAVLVAVVVAFGNAAGLVSSNVFKAKDEPKYLPALIISAIMGGVAIVGTALWGTYLRMDNRRRDARQGVKLRAQDVDTAVLLDGWRSPSFRWMY